MEGLLKENTQCGDEHAEVVVKVEKEEKQINESLNTEEVISDEEAKTNIQNEVDNLKDGTPEHTEDTAIEYKESESKPDINKSSDSDNFLTCSSSNNSSDSGTANVIKTGNSSLSNLLVYSSESSSDSDSSSESESYESPEVSDNEQESEGAKNENKKKSVQDTIRTFGELTLDDLPPVPDVSNLNVQVPEHDCTYIGTISGIIDRLVTVESLPNTPAYNLETLLFLDNGKKPLGYVYDVMGQVSNPIYVIRFNSREEMENIGVKRGLPVYSAPKTQHTQYVFVKQLMEVKGSDASWMGDNEVPPEHVDYSDDEEERRGRRTAKKTLETRKRNSLERHKDFEKDMNVKNIIDSRLHKIRDSFEPSTKRLASNNNDKRAFPFQPSTGPVFSFGQPGMNPNVPSFNPFLSAPFMPNGMQMAPFGALPYMPHSIPPMPRMPPPVQNVPPFMPSIPPPQLPQTMTSQAMSIPPLQNMHSISVPPPAIDIGQQKHPQQVPARMLYPTEMGLPRPLRNTFVPMYNPRVPNLWTYQSRPQNIRPTQNFCQPRPRGTYYPKKP